MACEVGMARRRTAFVTAVLPIVCLGAEASAAFAPGHDPMRNDEKYGRQSRSAFGRSVPQIMSLLNPRERVTRQRPGRRFLRTWQGSVDVRRRESFLRYGTGGTRSKAVPRPTRAESTP